LETPWSNRLATTPDAWPVHVSTDNNAHGFV